MSAPSPALPVVVTALFLCACKTVAPSSATLPTDASFKVSEVSCWDLTTLSEADVGYTYTLLYAYVAGQKQQSLQKQSVVRAVTLAAIEDCEENPDKSALQSFSEHWISGE